MGGSAMPAMVTTHAAHHHREAAKHHEAGAQAARGLNASGVTQDLRPARRWRRRMTPLDCRNYVPSVGKTIAVPCDP